MLPQEKRINHDKSAGEGHQEGQHPAQPRLLQRDVRGINPPSYFKFPIAHFHCQGSPQR